MSDYERIVAVDKDLINIARYTVETWGIDQEMASGREMMHFLHFTPRFLNGLLVFQ